RRRPHSPARTYMWVSSRSSRTHSRQFYPWLRVVHGVFRFQANLRSDCENGCKSSSVPHCSSPLIVSETHSKVFRQLQVGGQFQGSPETEMSRSNRRVCIEGRLSLTSQATEPKFHELATVAQQMAPFRKMQRGQVHPRVRTRWAQMRW